MHDTLAGLTLAICVAITAGACRRWDLPAPLLLVALGVGASYIPAVPDVTLNPDVVLVGLLPPLLYAAAIRTSLVDFRANRVPIALLSIGLVAFSTAVVGVAAGALIPSLTLTAGFALGAVVAPPDAVAAAAVARRVGMPRKIVTLLEDESLVNDAAALVALNTAIAALTRNVSVGEVIGRFALAACGGVAIGLLVAFVLVRIRRRLDDPVLDTVLSFTAPYVAFLPAEAIDASGVLAVVVTGLALGHRSPSLQSARSRIAENLNWRTVQFLLETAVFVLIGLQVRTLIDAVDTSGVSTGTVVGSCLGVLGATVVARAVWVFGAGAAVMRTRLGRQLGWTWQAEAVIAWSGMRGVVTLAAAYLLPDDTPQRDLLRLVAFAVVAGTLLVQGLTLPPLLRRLRLPPPDAAEDALRSAALVSDAVNAGLQRLDELKGDTPQDIVDDLRTRAARRTNSAWERLGRPQSELETPNAVYRRLRLQMLAAERASIVSARDAGHVDDEILRAALNAVDIEESLLDRSDDAQSTVDDELRAPRRGPAPCAHLGAAPAAIRPRTPGACEDCVREGTTWVHLRMCLSCGRVGCCDSSPGQHATRHFHESTHPVMRSVEPGEAWRWCYLDELVG